MDESLCFSGVCFAVSELGELCLETWMGGNVNVGWKVMSHCVGIGILARDFYNT